MIRRARDVASVVAAAIAARALGAGLVHALGFVAVSDDDFARVVIAQKFAAAAAWDPTGTSWLPLPFWIAGGAMRIVGTSLESARALAIVAALASGALLAVLAERAGLEKNRVIAASCAAAWMPWSMQLGVATVPEVPAAACAAAGALTLASSSVRLRWVGAAALLASTLSRYDAWPMAVAFAAVCAWDARTSERRRAMAFSGLVSIAGIVGWAAWQRAHFGDAFRYLRLVRSYRQALGVTHSLAQGLLGYPLGIVEEMREVLGAGLVGVAAAIAVWRSARGRTSALPESASATLDWSRPLALALVQLVFLVAGDVRDGAPTHHRERALLGPATIVLFAAGDAIGAWLATVPSRRRRGAWVAACAFAYLGWVGVRFHRSLGWYDAAARTREVAAGSAIRARISESERVLLDTRDLGNGEIDYGYYAVMAATGRPLAMLIDREQDPRKPRVASSFDELTTLRAKLAETGARAMLVWGTARRDRALALGARVVDGGVEPASGGGAEAVDSAAGRWALLRLP